MQILCILCFKIVFMSNINPKFFWSLNFLLFGGLLVGGWLVSWWVIGGRGRLVGGFKKTPSVITIFSNQETITQN